MAKVNTKYGEMDEKDLVKFEFPDTSGAQVTEYYLNKELVHRSVAVKLSGVAAEIEQAKLG